jgi:hypothetical protein
MLATCPLATFAQGLCCHVFEVFTRTFRERANGDQVLFNFRWSSRIKGNKTPKSWMRNHRHLTKMTLQGERECTVVGLLHCGALLFLRMVLYDLVFGYSSGDARVGNDERSKGSSSIPKSLLGEMTTCCGNWKSALSKSRIIFLEKLVPIFIGQMLGMSGLDCTHFCFVPLMQRSMSSLQMKNSINSGFFL